MPSSFNLANDGYLQAKGLNLIGHETHLFYQYPTFVTGLPEWEEAAVDVERLGKDLSHPNISAFKWTRPPWLHDFEFMPEGLRWAQNATSKNGEFDIIIGHHPFAQFARTLTRTKDLHKPWVPYEAGMIRHFDKKQVEYKALRDGYAQATRIIYSNVDMRPILNQWGWLGKSVFSPLGIDTERYKPQPATYLTDRLILLAPARHYHWEKGNDRIIAAFAEYVKRNPTAELRMCGWGGNDLALSEMMVYRYGISKNVTWLPLMGKLKMIEEYNNADIVLDQFIYPASGSCTPEALSCGKPVISHINPDLFTQHFNSVPPVVPAQSAPEIFEQIVRLEDEGLRRLTGTYGREWVQRNQDIKIVAAKEVEVCKQVISEWNPP